MFSKGFVLVCVIVSAAAFAQNQPVQGAQPQQSSTTVVVPPSNPSVVVVGGGLYGTGVYPLSYLPMAPSQNTAPQQAGTAGISFLAPSTYSGPGYSYTTPIYYSNAGSPYYNATPVNPAPEATVAEAGPAIVDFGPSYYVSESGSVVAPAPAPSLAEVAAHYRTTAKRADLIFTNAIAARLSGGEVIPGILVATEVPALANAPEQSQQPQAPSTSGGQPSQPPSPSQTAPPAAETPAQPSTQPQTAPAAPSRAPEQSGSKSTLPATSTLLPLLGALGFLSSAVGLWIARHKR